MSIVCNCCGWTGNMNEMVVVPQIDENRVTASQTMACPVCLEVELLEEE